MEHFADVDRFFLEKPISHFWLPWWKQSTEIEHSFLNMRFERMVIRRTTVFPVSVIFVDGNGSEAEHKNSFELLHVVDIKVKGYNRHENGWEIVVTCREDKERSIPRREYTAIAVRADSE